MTRVNDKTALGRAIHQAYHWLSMKHKIPTDKVAEIASDWDEWKKANLTRRWVQKVTSKSGNYGLMIRVDAPVTFYWNHDGSFDGVDFGPLDASMTAYQHRLLGLVLKTLMEMQMNAQVTEAEEPDEGGIPPGIAKSWDEKGDTDDAG